MKYVATYINHTLFVLTIMLCVSYAIQLSRHIRRENLKHDNEVRSVNHVLHFGTYIFISPFLISIAYSANSLVEEFMHRWFTGSDVPGNSIYIAFYVPSILCIYVFIWAFFRSIYIISLLDMGIWAKSSLFSEVIGYSGRGFRNFETGSRALIIAMFLEHHIVVSDAVSAPIRAFYGMSPGCKSYVGQSVPEIFLELPLVCGPVNTLVFSWSGAVDGNFTMAFEGHVAKISPAYLYDAIPLLPISALFVCGAIFIWSILVGYLYRRYQVETGDNSEVLSWSLRQLGVQRKCVVATGICAGYLWIISGFKEMTYSDGIYFAFIALLPLYCAMYVFFTASKQSGLLYFPSFMIKWTSSFLAKQAEFLRSRR